MLKIKRRSLQASQSPKRGSKKRLSPKQRCQIGLGALCGAMSISSAHAETTYAFEGSVDIGYVGTTNANGDHRFHSISNARWPSYLGFTGSTSITDKIKASVFIHSQFYPTTQKFVYDTPLSGQAYVALGHDDYGTLKVGRQADPSVYLLFSSPGLINTMAFTVGNADGSGGMYVNNTVSYTTPRLGNFIGHVMYGFGGSQAVYQPKGRSISGLVSYITDKVSINAMMSTYQHAQYAPAYAGARVFAGAPLMSFGSIFVDSQDITGASLSYKVNESLTAQTSASYVRFKLGDGQSTYKTVTGTLIYGFTPTFSGRLGVGRTRFDDNSYTTYSSFLDYYVTKNIDIYVGLYTQRTTGSGVTATLYGQLPSTTNRQSAYNVGARFSF